MLRTRPFATQDRAEALRLVRESPWVTLVSYTSAGLVASHCAVIVQDAADDGISLVSHLARRDGERHELGQHEALVIVQGVHGYVSASWYPQGQVIPTWDFMAVHLWGRPQVLEREENYRALERQVDAFEAGFEHPRSLAMAEESARAEERGTMGFRFVVERFEARLKLSQNQPDDVAAHVAAQLGGSGPGANPELAKQVRRARRGG